MKTITFTLGALLLAVAQASGQAASAVPPESPAHALVNNYCAGCHNDRRPAGGFSWTSIDLADPARNAAQSEKAIRRLRAGLMPPAGAPRPAITSLPWSSAPSQA